MNLISNNKKARFDYEIIETLNAGIMLLGPEVKSLREGKCNLKGSFCKFFNNELFLFDCHISKYEYTNNFTNIEETRDRKLLLTKKQLVKWSDRLKKEQHLTIVPLKIFFDDNNKVKVEIGLAKGKKLYDKRESEKQKTIIRDIQKGLK